MYALLTLPRGVPVDPEAPPASDERDAPAGIVIRPGPPAPLRRARDGGAPARAAPGSITA
jgi:hypothetical protein